MTRDDVVRITEEVLKGLTLEMPRSDFTDPNSRSIILKYNGIEIDRVCFDVVQKREYEG
jgi:hypothetical protein